MTTTKAEVTARLAQYPIANRAQMIPIWEHLKSNEERYKHQGFATFAIGVADALGVRVHAAFVRDLEKSSAIRIGRRYSGRKAAKEETGIGAPTMAVLREEMAAIFRAELPALLAEMKQQMQVGA